MNGFLPFSDPWVVVLLYYRQDTNDMGGNFERHSACIHTYSTYVSTVVCVHAINAYISEELWVIFEHLDMIELRTWG